MGNASDNEVVEVSGLLGCIFLILVVLGLFWVGIRVYHFFVPEVELALAVDFEQGGEERLQVSGRAYLVGKSAKQGQVKLTVEKKQPTTRQILYEEIRDGRFDTAAPLTGFTATS